MTPEEVVERVTKARHILIRHRGVVFFNTHDYDEALKWEGLGARIVAHFDEDEIARRKKNKLRPNFVPGWEVHVLGCVDKEFVENDDGDIVDITNDVLLAAARA
jgi:hypothetical protein